MQILLQLSCIRVQGCCMQANSIATCKYSTKSVATLLSLLQTGRGKGKPELTE